MKKETLPYVGLLGGVVLGFIVGLVDAARQAAQMTGVTFSQAFPTELLTPALIGLGLLGFAIGKIFSMGSNGDDAS